MQCFKIVFPKQGGFNVEGLSAYTAYNVTVGLVGGPLFNTAVFENHLGTRTFTTKEGRECVYVSRAAAISSVAHI